MKTTIPLILLPLLTAAPLPAQTDPEGPGRDLIDLFEKMHREGATEADLLKLLEDRSKQSLLVEPETPHQHDQPRPDRPAQEAPGWRIGLVVEPVPQFIREHFELNRNEGVRVAHVANGSPAHRLGIQVNDIILSAGDKKIGSLEDLKEVVERAGREGQPIKLGWIHNGERKSAQLRPEGPPPQIEREREERAGDQPQRPAMMRRMEEMARRMEKQQREIEELRREVERLKREFRADE